MIYETSTEKLHRLLDTMNGKGASMKIYVACLAAYNNGILHGQWIDVDGLDVDGIQEAIAAMLATSPIPGTEEWAIHDYDGIPSTFGENPDLADLVTYCEAYAEHGEAWEAYVDGIGAHYATLKGFQDAYLGEARDATEYAERYADETGLLYGMPENLRYYFDYESFGRDMVLGGDIFINNGHVFSNN